MSSSRSCLIIGAGMAGLQAGRFLRTRGWSVALLDKGRAAGGRMATRRAGASHFDHGAQFFTVREARFEEAVRQWEGAGWVSPWFTRDGHIRYRAVDGMKVLAGHLAEGLDVHTGTKVETVEVADGGWRVMADSGKVFAADTLLLTPPGPQSADLLSRCVEVIPQGIIAALRGIEYEPCFALLAIAEGPGRIPAPGFVRPEHGPLAWIADNTQKGISAGNAALTIHANAAFSTEYLEANQVEIARILLKAAEPWCGGRVTEWMLHRWRYSRPVEAERPPYLYSEQPRLAIAGDGFGGSRMEGAFLSGLAAAERIAAEFK